MTKDLAWHDEGAQPEETQPLNRLVLLTLRMIDAHGGAPTVLTIPQDAWDAMVKAAPFRGVEEPPYQMCGLSVVLGKGFGVS